MRDRTPGGDFEPQGSGPARFQQWAMLGILGLSVIGLGWLLWVAQQWPPTSAVGIAIVLFGSALLVYAWFPRLSVSPRRWWLGFAGALLVVEAVMIADLGSGWSVLQPVVKADRSSQPGAAGRGRMRSVLILAVNDTYRIEPNVREKVGGLARLRTLRRMREASGEEVLLLHAGDLLSPSLLSRMFYGEQMVAVLNLMDGEAGATDPRMLVVFGNHEFDKADCREPRVLRDRVKQSGFLWLASNIDFDGCAEGGPMLLGDERQRVRRAAIVEVGGVRIGVFGLTIDIAEAKKLPPPIREKAARLTLARDMSERLRADGAEVVIALTHLDQDEDRSILAAFSQKPANGRVRDGPDLLIGGHDHERMVIAAENGRSGYKADSDAMTVNEVRLTIAPDGRLDIAHRWVPLSSEIEEDRLVKAEVDKWLAKFEDQRCKGEKGCLDKGAAVTPLALIGDERQIRKNTTTLGGWVANEMLTALATCTAAVKPTIAFINSGSLRLNRDIAAGTRLTVRDIEELFGFESAARLVAIRGDALKKVFAHSFAKRGTGGWLQFTGLTVYHEPATGELLLFDTDRQPIEDGKEYGVVTTKFLLEPGNEDGFDLSEARPLACQNGASSEADLQNVLTATVMNSQKIEVPAAQPLCEHPSCRPAMHGSAAMPGRAPAATRSDDAAVPAR